MWHHLRRKQIQGVQFYRQKPLLSFIVDFYCPVAKLVVELDGSQHFEKEYQDKDQVRDDALAGLGLRVLRFDNRQVLLETDAVLEVIDQIVKSGRDSALLHHPPLYDQTTNKYNNWAMHLTQPPTTCSVRAWKTTRALCRNSGTASPRKKHAPLI